MAYVVQFDLETGERYHRVFTRLQDAMNHYNRAKIAFQRGSEVELTRDGEIGILASYALFQASGTDAKQAVEQVKSGTARLVDNLASQRRRAEDASRAEGLEPL